MYEGGLQKITITRQDANIASIKIGDYKLMEIEINRSGERVAVHKPKRKKPVAVDARELLNALRALLT